MSIHPKVNGAYKEMTDCKVKVAGAWKQAEAVYTKVNGVWKECWADNVLDRNVYHEWTKYQNIKDKYYETVSPATFVNLVITAYNTSGGVWETKVYDNIAIQSHTLNWYSSSGVELAVIKILANANYIEYDVMIRSASVSKITISVDKIVKYQS